MASAARTRAPARCTPRTTEVRARLGLASVLAAMNRTTEAIDELQRVIDMRPIEPIGARERAERELRAHARRRARDRAIVATQLFLTFLALCA